MRWRTNDAKSGNLDLTLLGLFSKKTEDITTAEPFELKFDLPPYRQQASKLPDVANLWLQLDSLDGEAVHLLVELNRFLHELNRTIISIPKRHSITDRCLDYAAPAIRSIYFEHQKGKALPENHLKREAVTAAIKCVEELCYSYKRVVKNDFNLTGKESKTAKRRLTQSAFCVLELIHAEQRLKALRYQKLGKLTWRDCNNVFVAIQKNDDARRKYKPIICLSTSRASAHESGVKSLRTTSEEFYILIQLFGFIDPNSLSLQQTVFVENYLKQVLPELQVEAFHADQLPLQFLVTSLAQERPPALLEGNDAGDYAYSIGIKPVVNLLKQDYRRLLPLLSGAQNELEVNKLDASELDVGQNRVNRTNAKAVSNREDIERLLALQNMLKKMREVQRADTRKYSNEPQNLYLYNGFTAGFRMLNANRSCHAEQNQLNISLAQRSASLAEEGPGDTLTHWDIINESAGGMLLRTSETRYIRNLFVGQLIVFAKAKDALASPACGWVVRIYRDNHSHVEISLKLLASQIESVVVQTDMLRKNAMGMPGFMILDAGEDLQLMMHQSHRLLPGTAVTIQRDGNGYGYTVGEMVFFQREFVMYRLQFGSP